MRSDLGQTILEYTIIVGIVTLVLGYMGTGIKRGVQSMLKLTADQVGNQQNSDQDFNDLRQGFLDNSASLSQSNRTMQVAQIGYVPASGNLAFGTKAVFNESTETITNTYSNQGFSAN